MTKDMETFIQQIRELDSVKCAMCKEEIPIFNRLYILSITDKWILDIVDDICGPIVICNDCLKDCLSDFEASRRLDGYYGDTSFDVQIKNFIKNTRSRNIQEL